MSVDGLGTVWSSALMGVAGEPSSWQQVTVYIDVQGVEHLGSRGVVFEMVQYDDGMMGEGLEEAALGEAFVAIDNITLHPCIDCEAKGWHFYKQ